MTNDCFTWILCFKKNISVNAFQIVKALLGKEKSQWFNGMEQFTWH